MKTLKQRSEQFKSIWSKFELTDKMFFWISAVVGIVCFLATIGYGNPFYSIAISIAFSTPITFLWALFKIMSNRPLMGRMILASFLVFFVGISAAIATEPEASKQDTLARLAEEKKQKDAALADIATNELKQDTDQIIESNEAKDTNASSTAQNDRIKISDPQLTSLSKDGKRILVRGYGPVNSAVSIKLANDNRYETTTSSDGLFELTLPESAPQFGTINMQSMSGYWIFKKYKDLHDIYYYSMVESGDKFKSSPYPPVITSMKDGMDGDEIHGYYLPNSKLLLKGEGNVLSKAETNDDGSFIFSEVKTKTAYVSVEIKSYTSSWFGTSIQEENTLAKKFINTSSNKYYSELPLIIKETSEIESIPFSTSTKHDSSLTKGKTKISQKGKNGERTVTYKVTYRGDTKIKSEKVGSSVTKKPVTQTKLIGTYVKPAPISVPAPSYS